jgi:hypothetical protein
VGARLQEIINNIQGSRDILVNVVAGMTKEELDQRPAPDRWSPGEILHHLQLTELSVVRLLERQVERAEKMGLGPDSGRTSLLHSLDDLSIERVRQKLVSPEGVRPAHGMTRLALLDGLAASRAALLVQAEKADAFDLSQLHAPHPAFGRLDMYQWILFIGQHELRHLHQIERELAL